MIGGRYRILRPLGKGGEGSVFLAVQEEMYRFYAVKELKKENVCYQEESTEVWKRLSHPGLPQIVELIEEEDCVYLIMEYIEGSTLAEIPEQRGILSEKAAAMLGIQICETLEYLHGQNPPVIFGDMKPENLILRGKKVVLVDFGSAVMRGQGGTVTGTKGYFPPWKTGMDEECDLYGLGKTMRFLVTGGCLMDAKKERAGNKKRGAIPRLSREFAGILEKCCGEGTERFQSAQECRRALEKFCEKPKKLCASVLTGLCVLLAAALLIVQENKHTDTALAYEHLLQRAANAERGEREAFLEQAIRLRPEQTQGYLLLLEHFLEDASLSTEEDVRLRAIFKERIGAGEQTCEDLLKKNQEGYAEVAYETGLAYWYFYEGEERARRGAVWFSRVLEVPEEAYAQKEKRAKSRIYQSIGNYRARLDQERIMGESVSFAQYWKDLTELCETKAGQAESTVTTLALWREMMAQAAYYMPEFKSAGVSKERINEACEKIEDELGEIDTKNETALELEREVREAVRLCREAVERNW